MNRLNHKSACVKCFYLSFCKILKFFLFYRKMVGWRKGLLQEGVFMGGVIKTLPEIASKFLFTSSRCELIIELLFLITLRNSVKSQSIVETIFLTFYGSVIKTLPEIASKFLFTSSRCELPYQLPLLISLRSGIKRQSIVETIFLTFYGRQKNGGSGDVA